jgi:hypothetical protein
MTTRERPIWGADAHRLDVQIHTQGVPMSSIVPDRAPRSRRHKRQQLAQADRSQSEPEQSRPLDRRARRWYVLDYWYCLSSAEWKGRGPADAEWTGRAARRQGYQ